MPQLVTMKLADIIRESQVRKEFAEEPMNELVASIKEHGILQPPLVTKAGKLLSGERRTIAAGKAGLKEIQVIVTDRVLSDMEVRVIQLTENMIRQDLTGFEKWRGCAELMCMNPTWEMKDLAKHLGIDASMVTRLVSPSKCSGEWQDALAAGTVSISDCYAASKLESKDQAGLLALKLSGASRDQLEQAGRKKRNGSTSAVRVSCIKIALLNDINVVIKGEGIDLDQGIEALKDAIKEMTKGRDQGLDAKTLVAVCKNKAKRGSSER